MIESKKTPHPYRPRRGTLSVGFIANRRSYEHVRERRSHRTLVVSALVALLIMSAVFVAAYHLASDKRQPSNKTTAKADSPMLVWGFVNDSLGAPVAGADVNVSIKDESTLIAYLLTTSDENGFYYVTFGTDQWNQFNTIEVVAKVGALTATNSTTADGSGDQQVDVQFSVEIPEFGVLPCLILTIVIVFAAYRGRDFIRSKSKDSC